MWAYVVDRMLSRLIRAGTLRVGYPDGTERSYGSGGGPAVGLRIADTATLRALCLRPELTLGEAYADRRIEIANDDLDALLHLLLANNRAENFPPWVRGADRLRYLIGERLRRITADRAQRNVAHHYDLSDELYRVFLDPDMQYSCAYFSDAEADLADAQAAKKAHIAAKLCLSPGMRVLDIGCGWGGMAMTLARDHGVQVLGVTLSRNQLETARARAAQAGLSGQVEFRLQDYRALDTTFDRIVSVGMLEHVGVTHYDAYFGKVARLLAPDGVALIHTIGRKGPPVAPSHWIQKYIFPGSYIPTLGQLSASVDRSDLWVCDVECLRMHYALTLNRWYRRFRQSNYAAELGFDDGFRRMWSYYLKSMEASFALGRLLVYQFQLSHRIDAVPLTRDYLYRGGEDAQNRQAAE